MHDRNSEHVTRDASERSEQPVSEPKMSSRYHIRPMDRDDDAAIAAVIGEVMPEFGASGPGFALHDPEVSAMYEAYRQPRHIYFVVEMGGRILGGAGVAPLAGHESDMCELRKMYFLPSLRGMGAGHALMARCLAAARGFGFARCYIETLAGMDAAQALYTRSGFRRIDERLGATGHFGCNSFFILDL